MTIDGQLASPSPGEVQAAKTRPFSVLLSARWVLVLIIALAVGLRVASALYQGNSVADLPGIYDQISYHGLAERVAAGYGFSFAEGHWPATPGGEPTAHWSYLYTLYLAAVYSLFGVQPLIARLIQAVLGGVLHTWFAYRIGRRLFGVETGILSAAFSAVYLYFVYYAGGLLTETFYFVCILWSLDLAMRIAEQRARPYRRRLWLELGLAIGITLLLRQVFVLFVPFLFLWIWWNLSESPKTEQTALGNRLRLPAVKGLMAAAFVVFLLIVPWTIRNYRAFETFVPLNTNAGFAFYWGNHPIHGTNFVPLLPVDGPSYQDLIPPDLLMLNEGAMDRALLKEALGIIRSDPARFVLLSVSRSREYFKFWPSPESSTVSNVARVSSFGIFLPLMLYGLWVSATRVRRPCRPQQRSAILLLYLFMLIYAGVHLATWTLIRYRLPVDSLLLIFAALGAVDLLRRLGWIDEPFKKSQ